MTGGLIWKILGTVAIVLVLGVFAAFAACSSRYAEHAEQANLFIGRFQQRYNNSDWEAIYLDTAPGFKADAALDELSSVMDQARAKYGEVKSGKLVRSSHSYSRGQVRSTYLYESQTAGEPIRQEFVLERRDGGSFELFRYRLLTRRNGD
jgi:hypothetical protein